MVRALPRRAPEPDITLTHGIRVLFTPLPLTTSSESRSRRHRSPCYRYVVSHTVVCVEERRRVLTIHLLTHRLSSSSNGGDMDDSDDDDKGRSGDGEELDLITGAIGPGNRTSLQQ